MTTINRITYSSQLIRAFDGRVKVADLSCSASTLSVDDFDKLVDKLYHHCISLDWAFVVGTENHTLKMRDGGTPLTLLDNDLFSFLYNLPTAPVVEDAEDNAEYRQELELQDEGEDDETESLRPEFIKKAYRERYGRKQNCGDLVVEIMDLAEISVMQSPKKRILDLHKLEKVATQNGISVTGNNNGQRKMNVANQLRTLLRNGQTVHILNHTITPEAFLASRRQA